MIFRRLAYSTHQISYRLLHHVSALCICFVGALLIASSARSEEISLTGGITQEFTLGVIQSLTGKDAETGERVRRAVEFAASELSSDNFKITLLVEDDRSDPARAIEAFQRLQRAKVQAIIGATWSETTNALIPLATRARIPLLNTTTFGESLLGRERSRYVFSLALSAGALAAPVDEYLDSIRPTNAALVVDSSTWGAAQKTAVAAILKKRGIKVSATLPAPKQGAPKQNGAETITSDGSRWEAVISKLKKGKPGVIFALLKRQDAASFLHAAKLARLRSGIFGSYTFFDVWRDQEERVYLNGSCFSYPFEQLAREERFVARYREQFGEEPLIFADTSYDAVAILKSAAESTLVGALNESLRVVSYAGLVGDYAYSDKDQFSIGRSSLVCIVNKAPIVLQGKLGKR